MLLSLLPICLQVLSVSGRRHNTSEATARVFQHNLRVSSMARPVHTLDLRTITIAYLTKIYGVRELVATLHREIRSRVEPRVLVEVYMYLFTCNVCG